MRFDIREGDHASYDGKKVHVVSVSGAHGQIQSYPTSCTESISELTIQRVAQVNIVTSPAKKKPAGLRQSGRAGNTRAKI